MIEPSFKEVCDIFDQLFIAAGLKPIPQGTPWEEALPLLLELEGVIRELIKKEDRYFKLRNFADDARELLRIGLSQ